MVLEWSDFKCAFSLPLCTRRKYQTYLTKSATIQPGLTWKGATQSQKRFVLFFCWHRFHSDCWPSSTTVQVHHVFINIDPKSDQSWTARVPQYVVTDAVHTADAISAGTGELELSEGVKRLKPLLLKRIIDEFNMNQCLIFCRTNLDCDNLEKFLTAVGGGKAFRAGLCTSCIACVLFLRVSVIKLVAMMNHVGAKINLNKYSCAVLAGMRDNQQRRENLQAFKRGECRFLICTDVAARGIDVKQLPYVINLTLPDKPENYIHRIGTYGFVSQSSVNMIWLNNNVHCRSCWACWSRRTCYFVGFQRQRKSVVLRQKEVEGEKVVNSSRSDWQIWQTNWWWMLYVVWRKGVVPKDTGFSWVWDPFFDRWQERQVGITSWGLSRLCFFLFHWRGTVLWVVVSCSTMYVCIGGRED